MRNPLPPSRLLLALSSLVGLSAQATVPSAWSDPGSSSATRSLPQTARAAPGSLRSRSDHLRRVGPDVRALDAFLEQGDVSPQTDDLRAAAFRRYLGYYGPFVVDTADGTVTHIVDGSSNPSWVGRDSCATTSCRLTMRSSRCRCATARGRRSRWSGNVRNSAARQPQGFGVTISRRVVELPIVCVAGRCRFRSPERSAENVSLIS